MLPAAPPVTCHTSITGDVAHCRQQCPMTRTHAPSTIHTSWTHPHLLPCHTHVPSPGPQLMCPQPQQWFATALYMLPSPPLPLTAPYRIPASSHASPTPTRMSPPTSMGRQPHCVPLPPPLPPARVVCHPALLLALLPVEMYVTLLLACCPSQTHVNSQDLDMDHHCCHHCHWDILCGPLTFPFTLQTQFASDNIKT